MSFKWTIDGKLPFQLLMSGWYGAKIVYYLSLFQSNSWNFGYIFSYYKDILLLGSFYNNLCKNYGA